METDPGQGSMRTLFAPLLLVACQTVPDPTADVAWVTLYEGRPEHGASEVTVYADDRWKTVVFPAFDKPDPRPKVEWHAAVPGLYAQVAASARASMRTYQSGNVVNACDDSRIERIILAENGREQTMAALCGNDQMTKAESSFRAAFRNALKSSPAP